MQDVCVFSGRSNLELAKEIASHNQLELGKCTIKTFPDGESFVQIHENVRGKTCFIVQSLSRRPNEYLMELLIMIDALKRASASSIVALVPYFAYARQDRKDQARVPISAKLVANMIEKAGADRIVTMDLHAEQVQGFFDIPSDHLHAQSELIKTLQEQLIEPFVVAAPDVGSLKCAKKMADKLGVNLVMIDKKRSSDQSIKFSPIIGDVKQKNVLLVDDVCSSAATLSQAAAACKEAHANKVFAMVSHGVFADGAIEKINQSQIERITVSDSIDQKVLEGNSKFVLASVAGLFGEAVRSIVYGSSISSLFTS